MKKINGYLYCWLEDFNTLSLISPGSVDLETFLTSLGIPMRVIEVTSHESEEWHEIRLEGKLYAVIISPRPSGPFLVTNRKLAIAEQLADIVNAAKPPRIRFAA